MQIKVYNIEGKEVSKLTLKKEVFGAPYNEALIHQVIVATLANGRQGTKSALTRSEVRGGGRKPWAQKGTGNARQGSIRAPQWIKGGIVFAPKPRDFSKKVNKQMKQMAFISALSARMAEDNIVVVESLPVSGKTKDMAQTLENLKVLKSAVIVTADTDENVIRSASNIAKVATTTANILSTYDVVSSEKLVFTVDAIKKLEEAYVD